MKLSKNKYIEISTISYLSDDINITVDNLKQIIFEKFKSRKAQDWKPHITIAERVLIPKQKMDNVLKQLKHICDNTKPFNIQIDKLEFVEIANSPFEYPYAIWFKIKKPKALVNLNCQINNKLYSCFKRPSMKSSMYNPHITLAYRDLTKKNFMQAKKFFKNNLFHVIKNFKNIPINSLQLIHHKNNNIAKEFRSFNFKNEKSA
ncbi:2'-5' RNA ligase family protein [Candidatus Parcubacteria bacterium]|nr:2'-5' RNA ligase family protein [Candidatus Parcubacteria bacterium]